MPQPPNEQSKGKLGRDLMVTPQMVTDWLPATIAAVAFKTNWDCCGPESVIRTMLPKDTGSPVTFEGKARPPTVCKKLKGKVTVIVSPHTRLVEVEKLITILRLDDLINWSKGGIVIVVSVTTPPRAGYPINPGSSTDVETPITEFVELAGVGGPMMRPEIVTVYNPGGKFLGTNGQHVWQQTEGALGRPISRPVLFN